MSNGAKAEGLYCCTGDERFLPLLASKYVVKFLFYYLVKVTTKWWSRLGRGRMKFLEHLFLWFSSLCRSVVACKQCFCKRDVLLSTPSVAGKGMKALLIFPPPEKRRNVFCLLPATVFFLQRMDFEGLKTSCEIGFVEIAKGKTENRGSNTGGFVHVLARDGAWSRVRDHGVWWLIYNFHHSLSLTHTDREKIFLTFFHSSSWFYSWSEPLAMISV